MKILNYFEQKKVLTTTTCKTKVHFIGKFKNKNKQTDFINM